MDSFSDRAIVDSRRNNFGAQPSSPDGSVRSARTSLGRPFGRQDNADELMGTKLEEGIMMLHID